ncbi:MAG TPA: zinc ribbon domain-containing protein [Thermomicrobiales bacterium]|nr:zinc ribbon domain-containing protein [Thermomicrobiales bacterium]
MPIYEYRCRACGRMASLFFRSVATVDPDPACPHCGSHELTRRMSRVWSWRSRDDIPQPTFEDEGVPFYGPDPFSEPYGDFDDFGGDGDSEENIAAVAREARAMAEMMGEPLDAEFDAALRHVEQGADPDDVFGELDAVESTRESQPENGQT